MSDRLSIHDHIEPCADDWMEERPGEFLSTTEAAILSMAISLKRIADTADNIGLGNPNAADILHRWVTNLSYEAGRSFQHGVEQVRRS